VKKDMLKEFTKQEIIGAVRGLLAEAEAGHVSGIVAVVMYRGKATRFAYADLADAPAIKLELATAADRLGPKAGLTVTDYGNNVYVIGGSDFNDQ
jgi:hypothetical protein